MNRIDFDRVLENTRNIAEERDGDAVLFFGTATDPIPRALIVDSDLPFEARIMWCYLRGLSDSPGDVGISPSYDQIQQDLGIARRQSVSNCLIALHLTRWISILPKGGNRRSVYLLHDPPLTWSEALSVNPGYEDRVNDALGSKIQKIRSLAQRVIDGAILHDDQETPSGIFRLAGFVPRSDTLSGNAGRGMDILLPAMQRTPADDAQRDLVTYPVSVEGALDFHEEVLGFGPDRRKLAAMKLRQIPEADRQMYLDDLAVQVIEKERGPRPIGNPIRYLQWMVNRFVEHGDVVLSGNGERVVEIMAERRSRRQREAAQPILEELNRLRASNTDLMRYDGVIEQDEWRRGEVARNATRISELEQQLQAVRDANS